MTVPNSYVAKETDRNSSKYPLEMVRKFWSEKFVNRWSSTCASQTFFFFFFSFSSKIVREVLTSN